MKPKFILAAILLVGITATSAQAQSYSNKAGIERNRSERTDGFRDIASDDRFRSGSDFHGRYDRHLSRREKRHMRHEVRRAHRHHHYVKHNRHNRHSHF